jgi:transcriptional regulator GlxA family with amidase domain
MDARVSTTIAYMKDNLRREVRVTGLSPSINLSSSRLRHVFTAETGVSPGRYLHMLRMKQARELLETTFLTVKEITPLVGMRGESHFVQAFKQTFGLTPAGYRREYLRGINVTNPCPDSVAN